ncbi:MAG: arylesterase [Cyclobacteriaceae bacterium]
MKLTILPILLIAIQLLLGCQGQPKQEDQKEKEAPVAATTEEDTKTILFFGNSLTAGYGLDISEAFPALIQERIDSLGLPYTVINAGLSGETTASGSSRVEWVLRDPVDIFVLELGGNDGLRGISTEETRKNLIEIIEKVRATNPEVKIILAGMQIPPNMGEEYTSRFKVIFPELAEQKNTALIPFLLKNVGGIPDLNLPDGIHPTAEGHKIVAENIWEVLQPLL